MIEITEKKVDDKILIFRGNNLIGIRRDRHLKIYSSLNPFNTDPIAIVRLVSMKTVQSEQYDKPMSSNDIDSLSRILKSLH